jgi:hypothetical protein
VSQFLDKKNSCQNNFPKDKATTEICTCSVSAALGVVSAIVVRKANRDQINSENKDICSLKRR